MNSGATGAPHKTSPAPGPACDLKCACSAASDWATITVSLKWYSTEEDAGYCQPWCHSPGSAETGGGGRFPSLNSAQVGRPTKPAWSKTLAASHNCAVQPSPAGSAASCSKICSVKTGSLRWSISKASAHDAQYAAGAILAALRSPRPPNRMGKLVDKCATSICRWLPGSLPSTPSRALHMPSSWPCAYATDLRGRHGSEEVVTPGACALMENLPSTLGVGDP